MWSLFQVRVTNLTMASRTRCSASTLVDDIQTYYAFANSTFDCTQEQAIELAISSVNEFECIVEHECKKILFRIRS